MTDEDDVFLKFKDTISQCCDIIAEDVRAYAATCPDQKDRTKRVKFARKALDEVRDQTDHLKSKLIDEHLVWREGDPIDPSDLHFAKWPGWEKDLAGR